MKRVKENTLQFYRLERRKMISSFTTQEWNGREGESYGISPVTHTGEVYYIDLFKVDMDAVRECLRGGREIHLNDALKRASKASPVATYKVGKGEYDEYVSFPKIIVVERSKFGEYISGWLNYWIPADGSFNDVSDFTEAATVTAYEFVEDYLDEIGILDDGKRCFEP